MSDDNAEKEEPKRLQVFYQNGAQYRAIFVGGAWAGITPNGLIQLAIFNDLRPMPEMVVLGIVDNEIGPEIETFEKKGIIREVEATMVMPLNTAKSLIPLLQGMIEQLEKLKAGQSAPH